MLATHPTLLALDFDGVICDGLIEYFQSAWKAYCEIWQVADTTPPAGLAEQFYRLRPVIETGWEMPVLLRCLLKGVSEDAILDGWGAIAQQQIQADQVPMSQLTYAVDHVRDEWIQADLDNWLAQHRFYPGIVERLQQILESSLPLKIITTKEGRFVKRLLNREEINLADDQIWGKEVKQPKHQTLRQLLQQQQHPNPSIWFVEDRLKTLQGVKQQPDLQSVRLFLADWGYNLQNERNEAAADPQIQLLTLAQFAGEFSDWGA